MKTRIAHLALAAFVGSAVTAAISWAKPVHLPPWKPPVASGKHLLSATLPSGQPVATATTVDWIGHCITRAGAATWVLGYYDASGAEVLRKSLSADAACTSIIDQRNGTVVATPCPAALTTSLTNEVANTTAMLANCVTANKCNP